MDTLEMHQEGTTKIRTGFLCDVRVTPPGAQHEWGTVSGRQETGESIECNIKRHVAGVKQMICFGIKLGSTFENAL
jgi:hypothetical protein